MKKNRLLIPLILGSLILMPRNITSGTTDSSGLNKLVVTGVAALAGLTAYGFTSYAYQTTTPSTIRTPEQATLDALRQRLTTSPNLRKYCFCNIWYGHLIRESFLNQTAAFGSNVTVRNKLINLSLQQPILQKLFTKEELRDLIKKTVVEQENEFNSFVLQTPDSTSSITYYKTHPRDLSFHYYLEKYLSTCVSRFEESHLGQAPQNYYKNIGFDTCYLIDEHQNMCEKMIEKSRIKVRSVIYTLLRSTNTTLTPAQRKGLEDARATWHDTRYKKAALANLFDSLYEKVNPNYKMKNLIGWSKERAAADQTEIFEPKLIGAIASFAV